MVVLILLILWAAVLTPLWLKRRREHQRQGSIETFHHQLRLLGRAGPKLVPPAHRLQTAWSDTGVAPGETGYPPLSSVPLAAGSTALTGAASMPAFPVSRPTLALVDGGLPAGGATVTDTGGPRRDGPPADRSDALVQRARAERRRQARRRRRDVVLGLVGAAILTGGLGSVPGLHALWALSVLAVLGVCGCVALAAYAEMVEADRRALRPIVPVQAPVPVRAPMAPGWGVSPPAARAGYPGAWDDEMPGSRAVAGG